MKTIFIMALVIALQGCATSPPPLERLKPAPKEQVISLPTTTTTNPARVRVVRDEGFIGGGVFLHLSLDGKKLASLNPGEYFEFAVDPGEYLFSAVPTDPFGGRHPTTIETAWRANGKYSYRTGMDGNLAVNLFRVPE